MNAAVNARDYVAPMALLLSENAKVDVSGIVLPQNWKPPCSGTPVDWPGPKTTRRDRNESRRDRREIAARLRSAAMLPSPMGRRPKSALSPMTMRTTGNMSSSFGHSTMTSTTRAQTHQRPQTSSATPGKRGRRRPEEKEEVGGSEDPRESRLEHSAVRTPHADIDDDSELHDTPLQSRPWSPASRSSTVLEPLLGTTTRKGRPPLDNSSTFGLTSTTANSTFATRTAYSKETVKQRRKRLAESPARARAIESCVTSLSRSAAHLKLAHAASSSRPKTAMSSTLASVRQWAPAMSANRVSALLARTSLLGDSAYSFQTLSCFDVDAESSQDCVLAGAGS